MDESELNEAKDKFMLKETIFSTKHPKWAYKEQNFEVSLAKFSEIFQRFPVFNKTFPVLNKILQYLMQFYSLKWH